MNDVVVQCPPTSLSISLPGLESLEVSNRVNECLLMPHCRLWIGAVFENPTVKEKLYEERIGAVVDDEIEPSVVWEQRVKDVEVEHNRRVVTSPGFSFSAARLVFPYHVGLAQFLIENGYIKMNFFSLQILAVVNGCVEGRRRLVVVIGCGVKVVVVSEGRGVAAHGSVGVEGMGSRVGSAEEEKKVRVHQLYLNALIHLHICPLDDKVA